MYTWCRQKHHLWTKSLEECEASIRGVAKAKVEEDLVEVEGRLFVKIVEDQDITRENA